MHAEGVPLAGGHTAPVVRVGDTVRRVAGPWTPNVHALMRGLRAAGVVIPEPRGLDDEGREVIEYVAGDCPVYPVPAWVWDDDVLRQVGRALRAIHDASRTLDLPRDGWRFPAVEPVEVICHGDVAPYNSVFRDRRLIAFIDWDCALPAPAAYELGYAAHRFVSLTPPENADGLTSEPDEQWRRVAVLCDAYGGADPVDVVRYALVRVERLIAHHGPHEAVYVSDAHWIRGLLADT